jgi:hypothetical protein
MHTSIPVCRIILRTPSYRKHKWRTHTHVLCRIWGSRKIRKTRKGHPVRPTITSSYHRLILAETFLIANRFLTLRSRSAVFVCAFYIQTSKDIAKVRENCNNAALLHGVVHSIAERSIVMRRQVVLAGILIFAGASARLSIRLV